MSLAAAGGALRKCGRRKLRAVPPRSAAGNSSGKGSSERGVVMIEFAATAFLFFFVVVAALELMRACHVLLSLQTAVNLGARAASLGSCAVNSAGDPDCSPGARAAVVRQSVVERARSLAVGIDGNHVCIRPQGAGECGDDAGAPRELIELRIRHPHRLLLPGIELTFEVRAAGRNEAFDI